MSQAGRILLIEDEEVLSTTLAELLQRRQYACDVERDLAAARQRIAEVGTGYNAVITDINLPDGSNLEMLDALPRCATCPPLIVITGFPSVQTTLRALQYRVFAYLVKPFDMEEFLATVDRAVIQHRLAQRAEVSRQRLARLSEHLSALQQMGATRGEQPLDQSLVDYAMLLLANNAESLGEAMDALRLVDPKRFGQPVRALARNPEREMLREAMEHTVKVLESTRRSFKSRELADLRRQLEVALEVAQKPGTNDRSGRFS
ncbi:MAG: response regulator [Gammaproteobacteria bacterium]